jgi:hypothetical protein
MTNQGIEVMLTAKEAHNPDALKNYLAELKGRIQKKDLPYLHIIKDFLSDHVTPSDDSAIELTSKFDSSCYSEYKMYLPGKGDIGRLNRDSVAAFDTAV